MIMGGGGGGGGEPPHWHITDILSTGHRRPAITVHSCSLQKLLHHSHGLESGTETSIQCSVYTAVTGCRELPTHKLT